MRREKQQSDDREKRLLGQLKPFELLCPNEAETSHETSSKGREAARERLLQIKECYLGVGQDLGNRVPLSITKKALRKIENCAQGILHELRGASTDANSELKRAGLEFPIDSAIRSLSQRFIIDLVSDSRSADVQCRELLATDMEGLAKLSRAAIDNLPRRDKRPRLLGDAREHHTGYALNLFAACRIKNLGGANDRLPGFATFLGDLFQWIEDGQPPDSKDLQRFIRVEKSYQRLGVSFRDAIRDVSAEYAANGDREAGLAALDAFTGMWDRDPDWEPEPPYDRDDSPTMGG